MPIPTLLGHSILIVEDEPLIVLDMTNSLSCTKAQITSTNTLKHALTLVEMDGLSAAILDHALPDGDSSDLCDRLNKRGIPYLIYSGFTHVEGPCKDAPHLSKPATAESLIAAVEDLILRDRPVSAVPAG